jgi:hypothetical protein
VDLVLDSGEGIVQAFLDERNCKVGYIDPYPFAFEFLRRVDGGAAATKRV